MIRTRPAKIVAIVGPTSAITAMLRQLFKAGVDTFRFNFSHGDRRSHAQFVRAISALETKRRMSICILRGLQKQKFVPADCWTAANSLHAASE